MFVQINLEATQVEAVAAFLRVINALENIRVAMDCLGGDDDDDDGRIIQQPSPRRPVGQVIGGGLVHVLPVNLPALGQAEVPHGHKLGLNVLIPIRC